MEASIAQQLQPGAKVAVTQQIAMRARTWTNTIRGSVVAYQQRMTGSWFAHSKNDKLWLDRLVLRKEDGELITLNLDEFSHVEIESPAVAAATA